MSFFKAFGGYAIGSAFLAGAGFVSVPILVRLLGNQEFGRWVLLEPVLLIGAQLVLLGINGGIFKQVAHDGISVKYAFRKLLLAAQPAAIFFTILLALVMGWLGYSSIEQVVIAILIWVEAILLFGVASLRAANLPSYFAIVQVVRAMIMIGFLAIALFGYIIITDVSEVLVMRFSVASIAVFFVLIIIFKKKDVVSGSVVEKRFDGGAKLKAWPLYIDAVRYGFPLLFTSLLLMAFQFTDRFILKSFMSFEVLAEYVIHVKVVSALNLIIVTPFCLWWPTERFLRRKDDDGGQAFFCTVANLFLVILLAVGGCLWLASEWLLPIFAPSVTVSVQLMLVLILSAIFFAMAYPLNIGLLDGGKTHKTIWGALIGLMVQVILCVVLIPDFGMLGAAYANLVGSFSFLAVLHFMSQKEYKVNFAYAKLLTLIISSLVFLIIIAILFSAYSGGGSIVVLVQIAIYLILLLTMGRLLDANLFDYIIVVKKLKSL